MLAQALRVTLLDLQASEHLEPVLLHDRRIAPAVRAIHERPSRPGASARLPTCAPYPARPLQPAFAGSPATRRSATSLAAGSPAPPRQLRTSDLGLAGIARLAGYESEFSFSRAFKRAFGVAPRVYRDRDDGKAAMDDFVLERGADR